MVEAVQRDSGCGGQRAVRAALAFWGSLRSLPPRRPSILLREDKEPELGLLGTDGRIRHPTVCHYDICIISRLKTIRARQTQEELFTSPFTT